MAQRVLFPVGNIKIDTFVINVVKRRFPGFKLIYKKTSPLMWAVYLLSFMWIWNRRFMTDFYTTIGYKVYIPEEPGKPLNWDGVYRTLRHEFIHMLQRERYGIWFGLSYVFPQVLAVLALPAFLAIWLGPWWLLFLSSLIALGPWPAPWRKRWEVEGYTQTMLVDFESRKSVHIQIIAQVIDQFTGANYWFMWPFRKSITGEFDVIVKDIEEGRIKG